MVGRYMAEAMRMDVGDAGRGSTTPYNVRHTGGRHRPREAEPELGPILTDRGENSSS
jgi:hypothetical protein